MQGEKNYKKKRKETKKSERRDAKKKENTVRIPSK